MLDWPTMLVRSVKATTLASVPPSLASSTCNRDLRLSWRSAYAGWLSATWNASIKSSTARLLTKSATAAAI
ncbi:hypothetical protein V8C86DRAFT_2688692 [Haematococcus lacustris]